MSILFIPAILIFLYLPWSPILAMKSLRIYQDRNGQYNERQDWFEGLKAHWHPTFAVSVVWGESDIPICVTTFGDPGPGILAPSRHNHIPVGNCPPIPEPH
jgi:hypothetical protein